MSRPRSTDPSVPLSIAVPTSLKNLLDQKLDYTSSRSRWVVSAIKEKLTKKFDYDSIETTQLMNLLFTRNIIDYELVTLLRMRVEEIEAAR